ncbi:MAG: hypothetical protein ABI556_15560 [Gemmatimonadales bacterium]
MSRMRQTRAIASLRTRSVAAACALCLFAAPMRAQTARQVSLPAPVSNSEDLVTLGASFDYAWFSDFSNRVADQPGIQSSSAEDFAPGIGASMEFNPARLRPLFARIGANFGIQKFEQVYAPISPLDPTGATGKVKGFFADLQIGLRPYRGRTTRFELLTGGTWAHDDAEFEFTYADTTQTVSRKANGWKWNAGASISKAIGARTALRLGLTYITSFKKQDADQNLRLSTGFVFGLGPGDPFEYW